MDNHTQRVIDNIREQINDILSVYKFKMNNNLTKKDIVHTLMQFFASNELELEQIKLNVVDDNDPSIINIIPGNLYSVLAMQGIWVPYFLVKDKTEYKTEFGTYGYSEEGPYLRPKLT